MSSLLKISEAAVLAIHTMYLLTKNRDKLISTNEIAETLAVSENHLAKVLQRLVKSGYIESIRGPKGGFRLNIQKENASMLEIYETIDGGIEECHCLLNSPVCCKKNCLLDGLLTEVNEKFKNALASKKLSELCNK